jgi:hypothetical protein
VVGVNESWEKLRIRYCRGGQPWCGHDEPEWRATKDGRVIESMPTFDALIEALTTRGAL